MFRRSVGWGGCIGAGASLGCDDVFLDSHANGLVSFRGGGAGVGRVWLGRGGGGGDHGTEGSTPERPWNEDLDFGGRGGGLVSVTVLWIGGAV